MATQQHSSGSQGHVTDPEHDGRLKENRDRGVHKDDEAGSSSRASDASHSSGHSSSHTTGHTQGAVKDPEHDGRLKENRDQGVHKGDK
jgi:RNA polymerase-associated protein CTR9/transcription factor SPN1